MANVHYSPSLGWSTWTHTPSPYVTFLKPKALVERNPHYLLCKGKWGSTPPRTEIRPSQHLLLPAPSTASPGDTHSTSNLVRPPNWYSINRGLSRIHHQQHPIYKRGEGRQSTEKKEIGSNLQIHTSQSKEEKYGQSALFSSEIGSWPERYLFLSLALRQYRWNKIEYWWAWVFMTLWNYP